MWKEPFSVNYKDRTLKVSSHRFTIPQITLLLMGVVSLAYAVITAPSQGIDLRYFQDGASDWVSGNYHLDSGGLILYPPFTPVLLAPLALLSFNYLMAVWIALNVAATFLTLRFAIKLFGEGWPVKAQILFAAMILSWAPVRVDIRNGQISLMITALLLGALLARKRNKPLLAGALLGISLLKYSLTFPFFLYFVWKREWKLLASSLVIPLALTQVFAMRLGISAIEAISLYLQRVGDIYTSGETGWRGTTEIKLLILSLTSGGESLTWALTTGLIVAALIGLAAAVIRKPQCENAHFAAMSLLALWAAYHRTYDAVLCIMAAALVTDFYLKEKFVRFSRFWLAGLGLFIISIPGLLTERLNFSEAVLSSNPAGWVGLHIERILVFGMFWSLLLLLWKADFASVADDKQSAPAAGAE